MGSGPEAHFPPFDDLDSLNDTQEISSQNYEEALSTVLELSDTAEPGTPEMDRLENLSTLIQEYEKSIMEDKE